MIRLTIGIDLGTSSVRVVVISDGAAKKRLHRTSLPVPNRARRSSGQLLFAVKKGSCANDRTNHLPLRCIDHLRDFRVSIVPLEFEGSPAAPISLYTRIRLTP